MHDDRVIKSVSAIPLKPLGATELYPCHNGLPDWKRLRDHFKVEGRVSQHDALNIIRSATGIFRKEPNMPRLGDPITVAGDIHGQYYDLLKLFEVAGDPPETQYLFLGDYVDRGSYSVEVLLLLYSMKMAYPRTVWLLRGNHECRQMTGFFNFKDECEHKFGDSTVYKAFMDSFDCMPIAATINDKFFCCHGGISPELKSLSQIDKINRFSEPPKDGLLCDLLWADPKDGSEKKIVQQTDKELSAKGFFTNSVRGCSVKYGFEATLSFLEKNKLLSVVRGHEAEQEGYRMHTVNPKNGFPTVITIFSAPNYCDMYKNKAAVIQFKNNTLSIVQFTHSSHPYHLPNFMDVFEWSIPFMIEKVTEIICRIVEPSEKSEPAEIPADLPLIKGSFSKPYLNKEQCEAVELAFRLSRGLDRSLKKAPVVINDDSDTASVVSSSSSINPTETVGLKASRLRTKVVTFSRLSRMLKNLREEHETVIKLKDICPGHRLKPGLLLAGKQALHDELIAFEQARLLDIENERRP